MEPDSQAKWPDRPQMKLDTDIVGPAVMAGTDTLDRMTTALQKANQLMERHLAAGEKTVPAAALYFILRDAGFGTSEQAQQVKQRPKQEQQPVNELHHQYGIRR
jgi:hypothetical protein